MDAVRLKHGNYDKLSSFGNYSGSTTTVMTYNHPHAAPSCRLSLFLPSERGAILIASPTASIPACLSSTLWSPCSCFNAKSAFFVGAFTGAVTGASSSALRTTFRPIASSKSASISSVAAALRLRFLRRSFFSGDDVPTPPPSGSSLTCSLLLSRATTIVVGAVAFNLVFLFLLGDDVAVLAPPPVDGVACWRRHSSGLRWSSDSANPRVKNRA